MPRLDIAALEVLERKATPLPWASQFDGFHVTEADGVSDIVSADRAEDGEFVAAMRNQLPALLRELRASRLAISALRRNHVAYCPSPDPCKECLEFAAYDVAVAEEPAS